MAYPEGADLSSHDGNIDAAAAKAAGLSFLMVKRTESTNYSNPYAVQQIAQARANGLAVGHYHFFTLFGSRAPVAQADHFCDTVGQLQSGDLPPIVDLEAPGDHPASKGLPVDKAGFLADYHAYIGRVQARLGKPVIIYTYPGYWSGQLGNPKDFAQINPLWLAAYPNLPKVLPGGWQTVTFHQWTDRGSVPGIKGGAGPTDCDKFIGTIDQLKELASMGTPSPDHSRYFPETGHYIGHGFKDKWEQYEALGKALEVIGYPITEELQENGLTVQYFERSRMEYHAGQTPTVSFGLVGTEALAAQSGA